jgi:hypothetical protein
MPRFNVLEAPETDRPISAAFESHQEIDGAKKSDCPL